MLSVVLAAYNGGKFITEQLNSILSQLGDGDEVIISDDKPDGDTFAAIEEIINSDSRVKYTEGPGRGVIANFEYGIGLAKGDYIFLSDQDDLWLDGNVQAVVKEFDSGASVVMHNAIVADGELNPTGETTFEINSTRTGFVKNFIKNSYQGSCMAFSADLKQYILPFPDGIPMHDQWIGLVGERHGGIRLIEKPYLIYRRHGGNLSGNGSSLGQKIQWRINLLRCFLRK